MGVVCSVIAETGKAKREKLKGESRRSEIETGDVRGSLFFVLCSLFFVLCSWFVVPRLLSSGALEVGYETTDF